MILRALTQSFGQLSDPSFRRVLVRALVISITVFGLLALALWFGLALLPEMEQGWLDWVIAFLSGLGFFVAMLLLFPAVMTASLGLFLDDIAEAVERRHYPGDPPGRPLSFWPGLRGALRFLAVVLGVNLLLLPLYAVLLFFPPLLYLLSLAVNGYLVGREYFELVANRYLPPAEADRLRRLRRADVWRCGAVIVLLLTIPILNFVVPIVATAFMVHVYRALRPGS